MSRTAQKAGTEQLHQAGSVRYAEKRRTGTCDFANRIAQTALDVYRRVVPQSHRDRQKHECVAAILAHHRETGTLQVVGLGVGTKFLSVATIREEECVSKGYGTRIRDCHAEVLARRAFRRQLLEEICIDLDGHHDNSSTKRREDNDRGGNIPLLQRLPSGTNTGGCAMYCLKPEITLHFYSSSAPCGNATLKKFAKMQKERYIESLGPDEWPSNTHEKINGHAIREGQFALLLKKDNSIASKEKATETSKAACNSENTSTKPKGKQWPANESDDWCPPGTTIAGSPSGCVHSCSDKLARWNCLGLQGSLLSSLVDSPLHTTTLTVGRKMTQCICRRAVCCRAYGFDDRVQRKKKGSCGANKRTKTEGWRIIESQDASTSNATSTGACISIDSPGNEAYRLNHPTIMGTSVYIDEDGLLDMSGSKAVGQDFRFDSDLCWVYARNWCEAEYINGSSGYNYDDDESEKDNKGRDMKEGKPSKVCTASLLQLYLSVVETMKEDERDLDLPDGATVEIEKAKTEPLTLQMLRDLKLKASPEYEMAKGKLLKEHRIFRQWVRRGSVVPDHDEQKESNRRTTAE